MEDEVKILPRGGGPSIAYVRRPGATGAAGTAERPGVVFLSGFMSDMTGTKATWLRDFTARRGLPYLRFDYSAHGASEGRFEEGTIGGWLADTLAALDELSEGPQILVGSSMGGWLALLAALARPRRVSGIVGLAAAPDFTEELVHSDLTPAQREALMRDGIVRIASPYGDAPYVFTRRLIDEGRDHLLLGGPIAIRCPVRLIHGYADTDVPWEMSMALLARLETPDAAVTVIKDGDHRLSRPEDFAKIGAAIADVIEDTAPGRESAPA